MYQRIDEWNEEAKIGEDKKDTKEGICIKQRSHHLRTVYKLEKEPVMCGLRPRNRNSTDNLLFMSTWRTKRI